ncbi:DUF2510 domain-containing protein [Agromyces sp. LHK192]|uniref:DUF2510 domain-containing protein n=1 Tax=Agromyces sp. LHK192 TaxID=2498704 RepID=UPI000FD82661|nr:DUF2510 domain-containing protein [Agromyces sp. LHK192]
MLDHPPPLADPDAPADWYPDPESNSLLRWWDGATWTDEVKPPEEYFDAEWWHPYWITERPLTWARAMLDRIVGQLIGRLPSARD